MNQIACNPGDPLQDMASSSASISSRGSMGRAKLQGELAAHKGVFFQNVRGQSAGSQRCLEPVVRLPSLLLALVEDPPQTLFSGRSLAAGANPRPFAPTASQRWVTTALQYLKELDVISSRRAEATNNRQSNTDQGGTSATPSGPEGGAAKAKAAATQNAEEEA